MDDNIKPTWYRRRHKTGDTGRWRWHLGRRIDIIHAYGTRMIITICGQYIHPDPNAHDTTTTPTEDNICVKCQQCLQKGKYRGMF